MSRLSGFSRFAGTAYTLFWATTVGCGVTRSSDTNRTATEQLLISDAIDRAVQSIDTRSLAGQAVFLDDSRVSDAVDRNYLVSTLRQHLLASGCSLKTDRETADYVVELRAGAIGTDRNDLLFGVPSMNVPQIFPLQPVPAAIPEVPIAKRRDQRGIAKIAVFAYHRESGLPVWQSGIAHEESSSNDVWILGAGPFQRGTIYEGTEFAGKTLRPDETQPSELLSPHDTRVDLSAARVFMTPQQIMTKSDDKPVPTAAAAAPIAAGVVAASHEEPAEAALPKDVAAKPAASLPSVAQPSEQLPDAASAELRNLLTGAASARTDRAALSMSVERSSLSPNSPSTNTAVPFARPVDPVPLPQPRFNSPR